MNHARPKTPIAWLKWPHARYRICTVAAAGLLAGLLGGCASNAKKGAATMPDTGPQGHVGFLVTGSAQTTMRFNVSHYRDGQPVPVGKCGGKDGETLRVPVPTGPQEFVLIPELEGASKRVRVQVQAGKVTLVIIRLDTIRTLRGGRRIGFEWEVTALRPGALPDKIRP